MLKNLKQHKFAYLAFGNSTIRIHRDPSIRYEIRRRLPDGSFTEWEQARQLSIYKHYGSWEWTDKNERLASEVL